ncbi:MAG: CPBP family intramembrane metalloprotease [Clostridiales bacterium]|nr:CPBP family intramembrane metalloprotease [Clostridiales bacterium]MDY3746668.1 CPBP family intramembrane glutamic endopeptidase [Lachnospiraceae bacterium]
MNKANKKKMAVYLLIALGGGWLLQLAGLFLNYGMYYSIMVTACMFTPLIGTVIACRGFRFKRTGIYWHVPIKRHFKWFLMALWMPALMTFIGAILYFCIFRNQFDSGLGYFISIYNVNGAYDAQAMPAHMLVMIQLVTAVTLAPFMNMVFALGEEVGWRGFMTPMLKEWFGCKKAMVLSGIIWAAFHYPLIIFAGYEYGVGYFGAPATGMVAMILFTFSLGTLLSYSYEKSQSIWVPVLAHGAVNAVAGAPLYFMKAGTTSYILGPHLPGVISVIPTFILALLCIRNMSKKEMYNKAEKYT